VPRGEGGERERERGFIDNQEESFIRDGKLQRQSYLPPKKERMSEVPAAEFESFLCFLRRWI
jgi:hypothetical protein